MIEIRVLSFLFLLIYFLQDSSCNELLSKFHQQRFKTRNVRIQLIRFDKAYYDIVEVKVFKYNRTTTAHNGTMRTKIDMDDKMEILVQFYKFMSNEYRPFPIRYQVNLRKAYDANVVGLKKMSNCGNNTFYFKKDITYYFCNFMSDESRFPPLIPNGMYKVNTEFLYLERSIALFYYYCEIYTPIAYPQ